MKDWDFFGKEELLHEVSLWLRPWEIPRTSPASPPKTLSLPPLLLRLAQYRDY